MVNKPPRDLQRLVSKLTEAQVGRLLDMAVDMTQGKEACSDGN